MLVLLSLFGMTLMSVMTFMLLPHFLLQRAIARPFPAHFSKILRKNIPVYSRMPTDLQMQLKRLVKQFLHEKKFLGCDGFEMTDEVRVTIAAKASMLLLNRPTRVYSDLKMILVYPCAFIAPRIATGVGGVVTHSNQTLSGESWSDGRVILAWDHVQRNNSSAPDGHDVVLHEFAHQLDTESGSSNGAPRLKNKARYRRWSEVMSREFSKLQHAAETQTPSVMDYYGATNPAEFFAVATETFFEKTIPMARYHPSLFEQLRAYFQVDPRDWN